LTGRVGIKLAINVLDNLVYKGAIIRKAELGDAFKLAAKLRNEDLIEIRSFNKDRPPYKSLIDGIILSQGSCWTIEADDKSIIGIFGVATLAPEVGSVWLLGSNGIKNIQREFIRHSKHWLEVLHKDHQLLTNCVYAENKVHINWLKWLGFTFIRKIETYGALGLPFYEFVRIRK
jgi:hypothetical protein